MKNVNGTIFHQCIIKNLTKSILCQLRGISSIILDSNGVIKSTNRNHIAGKIENNAQRRLRFMSTLNAQLKGSVYAVHFSTAC